MLKSKILFFSLLFCLRGFLFAQTNSTDTCVKKLCIQGDNVNVRAEPNTKASVITKLNKTEWFDIIEKGSSEIINGKNDYWYKINYKNKTGWIFGAFTSMKLEGRKTMIMTFDGCAAGDIVHIYFKDNTGKQWDFYNSYNNFCNYEFCVDGANNNGYIEITGDKKYIGQKFELVLNDLYQQIWVDWPECTKFEIITEPAIIFLKKID